MQPQQSLIQQLQLRIAEILEDETRKANEHLADPYWSSSGHNIGEDELQAVAFARRVDFKLLESDEGSPNKYADRVLEALEASKPAFRALAPDPDGYGIGTLHDITRRFRELCNQLQIALTARDGNDDERSDQ
jgi:hypothetical protein